MRLNMDIKKFEKDDIKLIAEMTKELFEDEPSDTILSIEQYVNRLQNYIKAGSQVFLFIEDKIIGYALVNLVRTPYYLIDFFICRNHRRCGKGTLAFNKLMDELDTKNIDLDVFCWNDRGRSFWESLGFKERAIIMRK
jgi:predicted acetyltransferase